MILIGPLISFAGGQQVDSTFRKTYAGIWGSSRGQILAILTHSDGQFRLNDIECLLGVMHDAPDGEIYGNWRGDKQMVLQKSTVRGAPLSFQYSLNLVATPFEGEVRLRPISPARGTRPNSFSLSLRASKTSLRVEETEDTYVYIGSFKKVKFGGHFSDAHYSLIIEPSADGMKYAGRLTYNSQSWAIKGNRTGLRLGFGVFDDSHGNNVGEGYLEWTPTPATVESLVSGAEVGTDQIYIALSLPKVLSNGHKGFLIRAQ